MRFIDLQRGSPYNPPKCRGARQMTDGAMFSLAGRTAIVTGAAAGIGHAIAIRLGEAGATIAVADLNLSGAEKVAASLPNKSFAVEANVSDAASVARAVEH